MKANPKPTPSTHHSTWTGIKHKLKKVAYWFIAVLFLIVAFFIYGQYFYTYSNGYRVGLLQKFSHKGNLIKTYEGELILSSISSIENVAMAPEKFYFSVIDKNLTGQFDTLQGQKVRVHYEQKIGALFWHGDSKYLVDSVKRVD